MAVKIWKGPISSARRRQCLSSQVTKFFIIYSTNGTRIPIEDEVKRRRSAERKVDGLNAKLDYVE